MKLTKTEGFALGYQITRRRLTIAVLITCLLYIGGYYLAQKWTLKNFDLTRFASTSNRPFRIQNLGEITKRPPTQVPSSPAPSAASELKSFSPPPSLSASPPPPISQEPVSLNQNPTLPSQLPSSDLATRTVPSLEENVTSLTKSDPSAFNLPSTTPSRMAEEILPNSQAPGNELGNNLGNPSGFSDIGQLLNSDLRDQLASPEGVVIRISNEVLFDFDSYQLQPSATPILSQIATLIQKYPEVQTSIEGHADTFGDDVYNQTLSENRAQAVHNWLRQNANLSVPVQVLGYGEQKPLANPQGSIEEQQLNRRVEIRLKKE